MMDRVTVFSPASVANVGPGYDTFGFALESIGDEIILEKRTDDQLVVNPSIGTNLPTDPKENVATIAIQSLLHALDSKQGFNLTIRKPFKPGSGLGSSASSAAGAVFAANELLDRPFEKKDLLPYALDGEAYASKSYHADNVAPALFGGFNVIRNTEDWDIFQIPVPADLRVLIIFPDVEIKTSEAKQLIPKSLSLLEARTQWANVAGVVAALYSSNYQLLKSSISDIVAEPARKKLIPAYEEVRNLALNQGAVGFNISGSGPSMFSFFTNEEEANCCRQRITDIYHEKGLDVLIHLSKINPTGCKVI